MSFDKGLRKSAGNTQFVQLRRELQHSKTPEVVLRRAIIGASVAGVAAMAVARFHRERVAPQQTRSSAKANAPEGAPSYGSRNAPVSSPPLSRPPLPSAPTSVISHGLSLALATLGGRNRAQEAPWLPLAASLIAAPPALEAVRYLLYQVRVKENIGGGHRIADSLSHIATFGLSLYESRKSFRGMWHWLRTIPPSYKYH